MTNHLEMLEVVDENDAIIGLETRTKIHKDELLHRDIHVWFITPKNEIIFQHRSKNKDSFPGKLDATVAGHVEPGMSYEETVVKECKEETGLVIDQNKLIFLAKIKNESFDKENNITHRSIDQEYAYLYEDPITNLQIEKDNSEGFELWKIDDLFHLSENDKNKFKAFVIGDSMLELYKKAKSMFKL